MEFKWHNGVVACIRLSASLDLIRQEGRKARYCIKPLPLQKLLHILYIQSAGVPLYSFILTKELNSYAEFPFVQTGRQSALQTLSAHRTKLMMTTKAAEIKHHLALDTQDFRMLLPCLD